MEKKSEIQVELRKAKGPTWPKWFDFEMTSQDLISLFLQHVIDVITAHNIISLCKNQKQKRFTLFYSSSLPKHFNLFILVVFYYVLYFFAF